MSKIPLSKRSLAFIDTETTGLDPDTHELLEIAIIVQSPRGRLTHYHTKIKPENIEAAHPKALEINGYAANPAAWKHAPLMSEVGILITTTLKNTVLVGHNVGFDIAMLKAHLQRSGCEARLPYHHIDTMTLAYEHLVPLGLQSLSLDRIRKFLGWSSVDAHTALKDVKDTRCLYNLLSNGGWKMKAGVRCRRSWRKIRERFGMKPIL